MRVQLLAATALSTTLVGLVPAVAWAQSTFDWSGFYAGGSLGVTSVGGTRNLTYPALGTPTTGSGFEFGGGSLLYNGFTTDGDPGPLPAAFSLQGLSGIVAVNAGYNLQQGQFVYGVEGDYGLLNDGTNHASAKSPSMDTTVGVDSSLSSLMSLRERVGVTADRLMFFATAGLAAGQTSLDTNLNFDNGKYSATESGRASGLQAGIIAGGGIEYGVNDNISLKAEALYYRLGGLSATATGSGSVSFPPSSPRIQPYTATYVPTGVVVETGINFHF